MYQVAWQYPSNSCWDISVGTKLVDGLTDWHCHNPNPSVKKSMDLLIKIIISCNLIPNSTQRSGHVTRLSAICTYRLTSQVNSDAHTWLFLWAPLTVTGLLLWGICCQSRSVSQLDSSEGEEDTSYKGITKISKWRRCSALRHMVLRWWPEWKSAMNHAVQAASASRQQISILYPVHLADGRANVDSVTERDRGIESDAEKI